MQCPKKYLELLQSINYKCVGKMENGAQGLLRARNDLGHYSTTIWRFFFFLSPPSLHFLLTVPSVCYHLLPGTVSIITKLAGRLYNFSSSVITDKSNKERVDRKDGTPSPYLNGPCSLGKIETPFSSKGRWKGLVYILSWFKDTKSEEMLFKIITQNSFHLQETKKNKEIKKWRLFRRIMFGGRSNYI